MNHLGPEGYHWRVCVEDKPIPGDSSNSKTFSWWDIQDENAALPVKEASQYQLSKFFRPPKEDTSDDVTKTAKGAFKSLGKAVSQVVGVEEHEGPRVKIVAFKLLDIVKMHDDFEKRNHGRSGGHIPQPVLKAPKQQQQQQQQARPAARPTPQQKQPQQPQYRAPTNSAPQQRAPPQQQQQQQQSRPQQPTRQPQAPPPQQESLMDFGPTLSVGSSSNGSRSVHHASAAMSNSFGGGSSPAASNESRAKKLQREYARKNSTDQRVWDDIDQRWVEADKSASISGKSSDEIPPKKEVGISLDPSNAVGKSAAVQAAVYGRVNEMRESQAKALHEIREREEKKKREESEEDEVRKRLEPRIKTWSEEHGKKKQLRALLASLHTILWPEATWKQLTIGDLLDDKKVKLAFHKASRVVHPDKAHHLDAEKRFLAKRIFDAISQAKTEFDDGKN